MTTIQEAKKVLTHLGYAIRKDSLTKEETDELRKSLTVAPKANMKFGDVGDPFTVFMESKTRFYIPRMWGQEKYGEPEMNILTDGEDIREDLHFIGTPYEYQEDIVNTFIGAGGNGLICVPCGRGKTFMAIHCARKLGKKFMVVVDKEFLLQQWSEELKSLLPGIRIGILQGDKKQIGTEILVSKPLTIPELKEKAREAKLKVGGSRDELLTRLKEANIDVSPKEESITYDCTIAMIQTLVQRDFKETEFREFGFAIFDECHHLGAAHFSKALLKIQPKHMLGLSATPTRDDGLTKVFEWFLGKPVYWEKTREPDPDVIVRRVNFDTDDEEYNKVPTDYRGETILARLMTQIVECEERNSMIDKIVEDLLKEDKRKILVLSERKSHLERIETGLPKGTEFAYYIGGMKTEEREEGAKRAKVLLATYQMASEAMNIKSLNTMIMASPRKKIEQSTGRILRVQKKDRDVDPLIVDIVDSHDFYQNQWNRRRIYYKKCKYQIEGEKKKEEKKGTRETKEEFTGGCMITDD
jgi:superfamily II DNA or RNA helicase